MKVIGAAEGNNTGFYVVRDPSLTTESKSRVTSTKLISWSLNLLQALHIAANQWAGFHQYL